MAILVVEGYKTRKIFVRKSTCQKKMIKFEDWSSGELSKIVHLSDFEIDVIKKMSIKKMCS
jgi:hypothetical protein